MSDDTRSFYDDLADDYHLIFEDWDRSMAWQGRILDSMIREYSGITEDAIRLLDCAAGIGTQAIPLAKLGYHVYATDLSPAAIQRAAEEARKAGARIATGVADLRTLSKEIDEEFDVVIAIDNALPHLLSDADLEKALRHIKRLLRRGGLFLASIRDYDALRTERPTFTSQRVMGEGDQRRITFQVWDWAEDAETYTVNQFILTRRRDAWHTRHYATDYRALTRDTLTRLALSAGFTEVDWDDERFYQPVIAARAG